VKPTRSSRPSPQRVARATSQTPCRAFPDPQQAPTREPGSNDEEIRLRDGTRQTVRTWDPATRRWKYTDLGKKFFAEKRVEMVAKIPVIVEGTRRDGRGSYEKRTHLPVDMLGLGKVFVSAILDDMEASDAVKNQILRHIGLRSNSTSERYVIYEFSDKVFIYDPAGTWLISSLTTETRRDGTIATETVLNQPMCAVTALPPNLLRPDLVIPEAFQSDPDGCVVLQLVATTGLPRSHITASLTRLAPDWRTEGVSSLTIMAFCVERDIPCYICYGGRVIHSFMSEAAMKKHRKGIAASYADGHAWFYSSTYAISHHPVREVELPPARKLAREEREVKKDVSKWKPWAGQFTEPGTTTWSTSRKPGGSSWCGASTPTSPWPRAAPSRASRCSWPPPPRTSPRTRSLRATASPCTPGHSTPWR